MEIWSNESIVAREQNLVFAALVDRRYEKGLTFGDTIHLPSVGNLTAQSKAKSTNAALVYETITEANTDISIATWEYSGIAVESIVKVQNNRDQLRLYASKMGYALDLAVDDVLAGLVDDFAANTGGTLAISLTYDDVLTAIQQLDDANAPDDQRVIVVSPAQLADWMKLDVFIRSDYTQVHGGVGKPAGAHYTRSWLGIPVYKSTNVEGSNAGGHDNGMLHREALALVMQMKPTSHSMYDIDYLVDKVVIEQLYGTKEVRDDHGAWMKGL